MPHKDPEARKAYEREWRKANAESIKDYGREYRKANREKECSRVSEYRKANREKIGAQNREYRKANREKECARVSEWYKANRERALTQKSEYYKANRERINARHREYRKANPEKIHARNASHRARKKECSVPLTEMEKQKVQSLSRKIQRLNKKGGVEYHIDHIVPMDYGGVHHPCNLRIMVGKENLSKTNKITPEALDLVPVCYRLYLERVGLEKAKWFRDEIAEAIGLDEANRLIGVALEDLME
jgi:hypothetical protein